MSNLGRYQGALLYSRLDSIQQIKRDWNASIVSAPTYAIGPYGGRSLVFDGSDDKITIPDLTLAGNVKSVALWVYFLSTTEQVIDLDGGTHFIDATTGTVAATGFTTPTIYVDGVVASVIGANAWHHVVITTATGFAASNLQLATDNTNFGNVRLRDLTLWGRVLTAAEVTDLHQGSTFDYQLNLVSRWDMSNESPPDVGFKNLGHDGTESGSNVVTAGIAGGRALTLGSNDRVDITDHADFNFGSAQDFSISIWAKTSVSGSNAKLIDKNDGTTKFELFKLTTDKMRFVLVGDLATVTVFGSTAMTPGAWHHFVAVADRDGNAQLYMDGVEDSTGAQDISGVGDIDNAQDMLIGADRNNAFDWAGDMDEVKIYNAALTLTQIRDLYERERAGVAA